MNEEKSPPLRLDYASPSPAAPSDRPIVRWGIVAVTCSTFTVAALPICRYRHSRDDAYAALVIINAVGIAFGIGGAFQRSGRWIAIIGGIMSFFMAQMTAAFAPGG